MIHSNFDICRHSARIVGGALNLADEIMNENILNGCHLGGGLHHSLRTCQWILHL